MNSNDPIALFRFSVIGSLISQTLRQGDLKQELEKLAQRTWAIPNSHRTQLSAKTIEGWYYLYLKQGLEGLVPKPRLDKGASKLSPSLQQQIILAKKENLKRSVRQLVRLMEERGEVPKGSLSRSTVHRLLQQHGLSAVRGGESEPQEYRAFEAEFAGDIWYSDAMHGPKVMHEGRLRKVYLISLMDDASRLVPHGAFCLGETALDVEGVLKQAVLKRGLPKKLVIDNGAAYRADSLKGICARLGIALIHCRPYAPQGKGKLERWHRTVRAQFLSELRLESMTLPQLNSLWWAWLEQHYHTAQHSALNDSPILRYQRDLSRIRPLGEKATQLDDIFYYRVERKVRRDGAVSYEGVRYEVDYALSGKTVTLVVDPHTQTVKRVVDADGNPISSATLEDKLANTHRRRQRKSEAVAENHSSGPSPVDLAAQRHYGGES
ncbi:integrase [Ectothiorhodospiraceae bacterium BW-2]|nr:integrase [Ectothiorhodospiraceae bacterium BW-2]